MSPSRTSSGMPDSRVATTGTPAAIASINATGMPSILPLGSRTEGNAKTLASPSLARTSSEDFAPSSRTRSATPSSPARARMRSRSGPSPTSSSTIPGRRAASRGQGLQEVLVALLRGQARNAHDEVGVAPVQAAPLVALEVDAAVHDLHRGREGRAEAEQDAPVVVGDRSHEARVRCLAVDQRRVHEQVVGVGGEAEGDPGQAM